MFFTGQWTLLQSTINILVGYLASDSFITLLLYPFVYLDEQPL